MVKLNKNRSENFLVFVSTRARSGSRPIWHYIVKWEYKLTITQLLDLLLENAAYINRFMFDFITFSLPQSYSRPPRSTRIIKSTKRKWIHILHHGRLLCSLALRDALFDIWEGAWKKNSLSPQKSEEKSLWKIWAEKKKLSKLMKNMLTWKNTKR